MECYRSTDASEVGIRRVQVQKIIHPKVFMELSDHSIVVMTAGEWMNIQREIISAFADYYRRCEPAHHEPVKVFQMDLFGKLEELASLIPEESGEVKVRFVYEEMCTPGQKGTLAVLNDIGHMHELAIPDLCKRTGLKCEVLDENDDCVRMYFPNGTATSILDNP